MCRTKLNKTDLLKKLSVIILLVAVLMVSAAYAEESAEAANIGDATFSFTNVQEYYDVLYKYPDEFELEIKEDDDHVRNIHRYHVEGYAKVVYRGIAKNMNRFFALFASANLVQCIRAGRTADFSRV